MARLTAEQVCERLGGTKTRYDWRAKCPAHQGTSNNSLSLRDGRDRVLLYCHAGCQYTAIRDALQSHGIVPDDLVDHAAPSAYTVQGISHAIRELYTYYDQHGTLVYQVMRFEPKGFRQRRPNPSGQGWLNNMQGVELILYHEAEVVKAVQDGRGICIVEGEKDVETLRALGFVATCNTGGAGKWHERYSPTLAGAHCFLLPDNDGPGHKHMEVVALLLQKHAKSVRMVELPDLPAKGDVSDWLAGGKSADDLKAVLQQTPVWQPSSTSTLEVGSTLLLSDIPPLQWAVHDLLPEGMVILAGDPKRGKSWLALKLAMDVVNGQPGLGHFPTEKGAVIYYALEDNRRRIKGRLEMLGATPDTVQQLHITYECQSIGMGFSEQLESYLAAIPGVRLIVLDTIGRALGPDTLTQDQYRQAIQELGPLQRLVLGRNITLLVIDHLRKSSDDDIFKRFQGSVGKLGVADTLLALDRGQNDVEGRLSVRSKEIDDTSYTLKFENGVWSYLGAGDIHGQSKMNAQILGLLYTCKDAMTVKEIMMALGMGAPQYPTFRQRIAWLYKAGELSRTDRGKYELSMQGRLHIEASMQDEDEII